MGEVYRAEHVTLGRVVAIKVLRPELASSAVHARRVLREGQAATLVRPGGRVVYATCSVLDAENHSTHPGGQPGLHARSSRLLLPHRDGGDGFFIAVFDAAR